MENKDSLAKKASYLRIAAAELAEGMKEGSINDLNYITMFSLSLSRPRN